MSDTLTIDELGSFISDLAATVRDADYSETLGHFMPVIAAQEASMFANETDSTGSPWAPLKPSTVKRKGNDRILVETGALIASLVNIGGPGNVNEVFEKGLVFGTDLGYALFHQDGTKAMPSHLPVGMSEEAMDRLCNTVADAIVELLKG